MSMTYKVNVMILRDQAERRGIRSVEELSEISGVKDVYKRQVWYEDREENKESVVMGGY